MRCQPRRVFGMCACLALWTGCDRTAPGTAPSTSSPPANRAAPTSSAPEVRNPAEPTAIVITKKRILVGHKRVPIVELPADRKSLLEHGLDAKHKRSGPNDLFILPLAGELKRQGRTSEQGVPAEGSLGALVIADSATPYRLLVEVLYTLGQSGYGWYSLARTEGDRTAKQRRVEAPSLEGGRIEGPLDAGDGGSSDRADLEKLARELDGPLTLTIVDEGYWFVTKAGPLAPGCETNAADAGSITVPRKGDKYDTDELTRCAKKIKATNTKQRGITIAAWPAIPYGVVLDAMDAVRGRLGGDELFPEVRFGVHR